MSVPNDDSSTSNVNDAKEEANRDHSSTRKLRESVESTARIFVLVLAATTTITLFARHHWCADLLANLRVQQVLGLGGVMVLCACFWQWRWVGIAAILTTIHLTWFAGTIAAPRKIAVGSPEIVFTSINALTSNPRHDEVIRDVTNRDPDVIAILELSSALAAELQNKISAKYPHSILRPQDQGNFGIGLFSKHPLLDQEVFTLDGGVDSIGVTIVIAKRPFRVVATHTVPPMGRDLFHHRNAHLTQLADRLRQLQERSPETSVVVVGDLNLTPWSPYFTDFQRGSSLARANGRWPLQPTWYRFPSFPFGLVLDHGLISQNLACKSYQVGPDVGSDHRSITIRVGLAEVGG